MIAKLRGLVDSTQDQGLIIDVNGVGYAVQVSHKTLMALPPSGSEATLLIQTLFRPESLDLYGFSCADEKRLFNLLMTVQGVGARVALAILSALSPDEIRSAILTGDKTALTRADGVGPKLAIRLLTELKDKFGGFDSLPVATASGAPLGDTHTQDAMAALLRLGFKRPEVEQAVRTASNGTSHTPQIIKDALALLTQGTRHG
jgi:Holliday junction DNA helicase RuvA